MRQLSYSNDRVLLQGFVIVVMMIIASYSKAETAHFLALQDNELDSVVLATEQDFSDVLLQSEAVQQLDMRYLTQMRHDRYRIQQLENTVLDPYQQQKTLKLPNSITEVVTKPKKIKILEIGLSGQANTVQITTEDKVTILVNPEANKSRAE